MVSFEEALRNAKDKGLDLVEIVPKSNPAVCKIMDYKKFLYETIKKTKDSKKKQSSGELKTLKIRLSIGESDLNIKINQIKKFLENGDKVKIIIMFRGREILYSKNGFVLVERIIGTVSEIGKIERRPKLEGRNLITILSPFSKSEIKKG